MAKKLKEFRVVQSEKVMKEYECFIEAKDLDEAHDKVDEGSEDKFWKTSAGKELDDLYGLTENMAQYEADQEAERIGDNKEIIDYSKGEKVNV